MVHGFSRCLIYDKTSINKDVCIDSLPLISASSGVTFQIGGSDKDEKSKQQEEEEPVSNFHIIKRIIGQIR